MLAKASGVSLFGLKILSFGDKEADARQAANDAAINQTLIEASKSSIDLPEILMFLVVIVVVYFLFK